MFYLLLFLFFFMFHVVTVIGNSVLYQHSQCKLIFGPQVFLPR